MPVGPAIRLLVATSVLAVAASACTASSARHATSSTALIDPSAPAPASDSAVAPQPTGTVSVYPLAGTRTALPQTQISLRNVAPSAIGRLTVIGSESGAHTGSLRPDSDHHGASFVPTRPFRSGETVTVHTALHLVGGRSGSYSFRSRHPGQ